MTTWIVEIVDDFLPQFAELDEQVRTEILAHSRLLTGQQLAKEAYQFVKRSSA